MKIVVVGLMVGCFCITSCGKREKGDTYELETHRAEDMMTSSMRDSTPRYLILRVNRASGAVAAVVTNEVPQQTEAAFDELPAELSKDEQKIFAKGKQVQLQQGRMKIGESPAQTYYNGDCQIVQQQQMGFQLGTPQCSPAFSVSKETGFAYGLQAASNSDEHSFYRFGLKSYFGKDFEYPFTQQKQPQFQEVPAAPTQQAPVVQSPQEMPMMQVPNKMPHFQQEPMPTQAVPSQQEQPFPIQGNGQQPMVSQGNGQPFGSQGNGQQGFTPYEPPPIPTNGQANAGQGFPMNGGQGVPMNGGQGFSMNGGQGFPMNGGQRYPPY